MLYSIISQLLLFAVQLLSRVWLFVIPWTAACQASLSFTIFWSLPKLMSVELVTMWNRSAATAAKALQSCPTLCAVVFNSLRAHEPTRLLCLWDFTGKNTGVGCHFLFQGIFVTQGSNLGLLHCRQTLYHLSHQGSLSWWCHLQIKMSKAS